MAIYSSSARYSLTESGQEAFRAPVNTSNYRMYTVVAGDTLESISARLFGTTERYWEIADLNPQIKFPLDLTPGTALRIPT